MMPRGYKHSEEARRKIRESKKGEKNPMYGKRGEKSPRWGKKYSEKTKGKISEAHKGMKHTEESKQKMRVVHMGVKHTEETKRKMREARKGEKCCNWKGGITPVMKRIRNSPQYKNWRQWVYMGDNFTCQDCGERGGILNAHHNKKSFKQLLEEVRENLPLFGLYEGAMLYSPLWDLSNGITLCKQCHKKLSGREDER